MTIRSTTALSFGAALLFSSACQTSNDPVQDDATATQAALESGDPDRGNGATQTYATRLRCAAHLADPRSRVYEIGHRISPTMPQSPFGDGPLSVDPVPTAGLPFTRHAGNGELVCGGLASQGTQMDALGHFGVIAEPWAPGTPFPVDSVRYFNGLTQAQVKPTPASPLLRLGIEHAVPIMTSAVILDAEKLRGRALNAGEQITLADVQAMLAQPAFAHRGVLAGDAVFLHTGWGRKWTDPAPNPAATAYYAEGPGLAPDAQAFFASKRVVIVALDNPFTDPLRACQLDGSCAPPPNTPPGLPFAIHDANLRQSGIHQMQNLKLDELADDGVKLACTIVLPLRITGGAGSPVRPIAVGVPTR